MYCGSCLRDNAMATELMARGHDVILLPVYTPTFTDEPNVSRDHVVLGGISAYLEQYVPMFRKTPRWLDRLWDSKTVLSLASRRSISTNPKMLGEMTVSVLKGEGGFQSKEIDKFVDWMKQQAPPDVINLPYSLLISMAAPLKQALNAPVVCTLQGEDLFLDGLQEPYRTQALDLIRDRIDDVDLFLSVSEYYARFMPGYLGIPAEKICVVPLGINPKGFELRKPERGGPFTVGFLARVAPEQFCRSLVVDAIGDRGIDHLAPELDRVHRDQVVDVQHVEFVQLPVAVPRRGHIAHFLERSQRRSRTAAARFGIAERHTVGVP